MPMLYLVHRVCEEFQVLPSVAARAIEEDSGLLGDVLDVRAFVGGWRAQMQYEADAEHLKAPDLPKALRDRITRARVARLLALKER